MGFGITWRRWIRVCLKSAYISILDNGARTNEFLLGRGVRQRDPLLPFLYIIVTEGLNLLTKTSIESVGVNNDEVNVMALRLGCNVGSLHLIYLMLPIGERINKAINWAPVVKRFQDKVSKWKARLMSFGGRLTLVKVVLTSLQLYFLSIFRSWRAY
ncbi:uncharacterized protein [Rutidosis leptorrhynchoides]|uniref:uncharacterized protein n=1 Tax=Rutidosis leptorrhynchoides TaxID=125765 RepID=UPI003A9A667A